MNDISKQIDVIVREVVRRLKPDDSKPDDSKPAVSDLNYISDRVVTLAQIENKIDGATEIAVRTDAVVTPSVIDLLREKSVRLVRRAKNGTSKRPMLVAIFDCDMSVDAVTEKLIGLDIPTRVVVESDESRLLKRIGDDARTADNSVVLTSRPYRFSCQANRNDRIRAVVAHDQESAARAKKEASANVLVFDTTVICPRIIRSFCTTV